VGAEGGGKREGALSEGEAAGEGVETKERRGQRREADEMSILDLLFLNFWMTGFCLVVPPTTLWVLIDANTLKVRKGRLGGGFFDMGVAGWFFSCLLLWIVAFPAYLAKRGEYKRLKDGKTDFLSDLQSMYCQKCGSKFQEGFGFCRECGTPRGRLAKPKGKTSKIILFGGGFLILVLGLAVLSDFESRGRESTKVPTPMPEAARSLEWWKIKNWQGSGTKETESFSVNSREWRISWQTQNEPFAGAGIFQIYVYNEGGEMLSVAANKQGIGQDVSYVRAKPGRFYLQINSANVDWSVVVEDQR
jgi:hypothetical protein